MLQCLIKAARGKAGVKRKVHTCLGGVPYVVFATCIRVRGTSREGQLAANVFCVPLNSTGELGHFS